MKRLRAERVLDVLNLLLSDVRYGLGAYLGVYLLTEHGWTSAGIGAALSAGGMVGLLCQTPIGLLVDAIRAKRQLLAAAVVVVTATCLVIPLVPQFWPVVAAGVVGALAGTAIAPTLAAISLGIVGPGRFAGRAGRNEAMFHLRNDGINLLILATAPLFGTPVLFWLMAATGLASAAAALAVPERAIDHAVARGLRPGEAQPGQAGLGSAWRLLRGSRPLMAFALGGALFPVVVADLTRGSGHFAGAQGAVGTVHALGGIVSGVLAGTIVVQAGYDAAFLTLAAVAALGGLLFWLSMPETRDAPVASPAEGIRP